MRHVPNVAALFMQGAQYLWLHFDMNDAGDVLQHSHAVPIWIVGGELGSAGGDRGI